ncbi:hypothetical protein [Kribbella endophytica]
MQLIDELLLRSRQDVPDQVTRLADVDAVALGQCDRRGSAPRDRPPVNPAFQVQEICGQLVS